MLYVAFDEGQLISDQEVWYKLQHRQRMEQLQLTWTERT